MRHIELSIEGMDCANCALGIERQLKKLGARDVHVNFATSSAQLSLGDETALTAALSELRRLGYRATLKGEAGKDPFWTLERKFFVSFVFTVPLLLSMFLPFASFLGALLMRPAVQLALALPVFAIGAVHFGRSAFRSLKSGIPNMDVLIFVGITAAFVYSLIGTVLGLGHDYLFYETCATISTIVLFGNLLEKRSVKKTTTAIRELSEMQPLRAKRVISEAGGDRFEEIETSEIAVGDMLLVNTGDRVPTDGAVVSGEALVDESMISGESAPVVRGSEDIVLGGTVLANGGLLVRATAIGENTVLAHIIRLVQTAQSTRPAIQRIGDRVSAVFVPIVLLLSLLTFLYWFAFYGAGFQTALLTAIAVLVISCPCAMGLATPTAIMVGLGQAAKSGILIKGGDTLERLTRVHVVAFDKTGTITTGNFLVTKLDVRKHDSAFIRSVVHGLEQDSSHPIARSLVRAFNDALPKPFMDVSERKGVGMTGKDEAGHVYEIGSAEILPADVPESERRAHDLWIMEDGEVIAALDIEDELKKDAAASVRRLRELGLHPVLISGDTLRKCTIAAERVGITEVYAEKSPEEKLRIVEDLDKKSALAFVGDGINDAPALARATVGISLSDATGVAIESAQVILLKGDLHRLIQAILVCRRTLRVIKQNLFWAFSYNVIAIPLAAMGYLNPLIASLAMATSDVIVVLNSLRLKKKPSVT